MMEALDAVMLGATMPKGIRAVASAVVGTMEWVNPKRIATPWLTAQRFALELLIPPALK